jgi:hypothetical protein
MRLAWVIDGDFDSVKNGKLKFRFSIAPDKPVTSWGNQLIYEELVNYDPLDQTMLEMAVKCFAERAGRDIMETLKAEKQRRLEEANAK